MKVYTEQDLKDDPKGAIKDMIELLKEFLDDSITDTTTHYPFLCHIILILTNGWEHYNIGQWNRKLANKYLAILGLSRNKAKELLPEKTWATGSSWFMGGWQDNELAKVRIEFLTKYLKTLK